MNNKEDVVLIPVSEYRKLKAERDFFLDYFKKNPNCEFCKNSSLDCENCGWYPWTDENVVPYNWEWKGLDDE